MLSTKSELMKYADAFVILISKIEGCREPYKVDYDDPNFIFYWKNDSKEICTIKIDKTINNEAVVIIDDHVTNTHHEMILENGLELANIADYVIRNLVI